MKARKPTPGRSFSVSDAHVLANFRNEIGLPLNKNEKGNWISCHICREAAIDNGGTLREGYGPTPDREAMRCDPQEHDRYYEQFPRR